MNIVYIAGPYIGDGTQESIEKNIYVAEMYAIELVNNGIGFFCPHLNSKHFEIKTDASEDFYLKMDMEFLKNCCDTILMIPGWSNSKGATMEFKYALKNKYTIFLPRSLDDVKNIKQWNLE